MKNIRHIFIWYNNELNKKNGCSETLNFSTQRNKKNNRRKKVEKVERFTYCEEFDNTGNDDIQ